MVLPVLPRTLLSWLGLSFPTSPWDEPQVSLRGLEKSSSHKTSHILDSGLALSPRGHLPSRHPFLPSFPQLLLKKKEKFLSLKLPETSVGTETTN